MPNTQKVDWDKYAEVLDRELVTSDEESPSEARYEQLVNAIRTSASEATPMRVRRTGEERWMNSEIKRARRERNHYRRDMTRRREEWVAKTTEVKDLTREAKTRVWREHLRGIEEKKDVVGAWRAVKNLSGGERPSTGKAIVYRGRRCTTDRAKANVFNQEYAQVSYRKSNKESRKMAVQVAKRFRTYSTEDPAEADFTEAELYAALGKVKPRKAAGLDGVGSDYVKRLTCKARRWFLTLINVSWRRGWIPQAWRSGLVIPILKKGKPPEVLGSYRPSHCWPT